MIYMAPIKYIVKIDDNFVLCSNEIEVYNWLISERGKDIEIFRICGHTPVTITILNILKHIDEVVMDSDTKERLIRKFIEEITSH